MTFVSGSALGSRADGLPGGRAFPPLDHPRPRLLMDGDVVWEQLAHSTGRDLDFIEIIYAPGDRTASRA